MVAHRSSRPALLTTRLVVGLFCTAAANAACAEGTQPADPEPEPAVTISRTAAVTATANAFALLQAQTRLSDAPSAMLEGSAEIVAGMRPQLRQGGVSTSLLDVSNRVWLGWGRAAFGVGIGGQTPQIDLPLDPLSGAPLQATHASMSIGWRYRLSDSSSVYAGASAARDGGTDEALPLYRAKAGVEWKTARSRLGFDGGRLGLQLDSGYRMSIRTRSGGLQIALRRTF